MRLKYDVSVSQSKHSSALSSVIDPRHCLTLIASAVTYVPHVAVTKEFSYYLLLVDVGLRSFTIFECPTRCRHRDASWRSRLYQHRQHATVVSSSVTRLCGWRSLSECPVAICTSWACIYVLLYQNNYCHPDTSALTYLLTEQKSTVRSVSLLHKNASYRKQVARPRCSAINFVRRPKFLVNVASKDIPTKLVTCQHTLNILHHCRPVT